MKTTAFSLPSIFYCLIISGICLCSCSTSKKSGTTGYANRSEYEAARTLILKKDSMRSFDADIVLSEMENAANKRLLTLQSSMLDYYDSVHFFPPAHHFFKSKAHIYSTPLFALLKKMPKGGIHHLHPSAGGSYWWIVDRAIKEKDCYVFWQNANGKNVKGELAFFKPGEAPAGFVHAADLNNSVSGFRQQLYDLLRFDNGMMRDW